MIVFFNPEPVMKFLEVFATIATVDETFRIVKKFGESLDKTAVIAKDPQVLL